MPEPRDARVSVVIATRNRSAELCRTLRELTALRPRPPVIVVDNASTDGTAEIVRRRFPDVDVLRLPVNRAAAARNAGVLRADTPYVAFSDDDSWWAPDALGAAADALDGHPRLGLVAAAVDVGEDGRPDPVNDALAQGLPPRPGLPGPPVLGFLGCAAVVRREAFWSVRGFSGALFFGAEETLLAYDLAAAGWELCHLPWVRARHVPSAYRPAAEWRTAMERRNGLLIAAMRRPWPVVGAYATGLARDAVRDPAARRALLGAIRRAPVLRRRARLPDDVEGDIRRLRQSESRSHQDPGPRDHPGEGRESRPDDGSVVRRAAAGIHRRSREDPGSRAERGGLGVREHAGGGWESRPRHGVAGDPHPPGRVTVVVITRDRWSELDDVLRRMAGDAPVIVVDNGSADGTPELVERHHPDVRLIRAGQNLGAAARNLAVRYAGTPYVAFCDDDTWWEPGALDRAAGLLDAHPALASVTGRILVEPGGREDPITPELRDSPVPHPPWLPGTALLSVLAGATMMRVDAFRDAGGFSPRLWLGGEEELLCLDLAARGWWMCWAEDVVVHHRPSRVRDPRGRRRLGIRNTLWTAWLRRRLPGALRHTATVLRGAPRDRTTVVAVAEAVRGLPWVLRERRAVPRHVERAVRLLDAPRRSSRARRYVG